jgi:hypothetical protein
MIRQTGPPSSDSSAKMKKSYAKHNKSLEQELNLSDSQQQGCSTAYSTPFHLSRLQRIHPRVCLKCNERHASRYFHQLTITPNMVFEQSSIFTQLECAGYNIIISSTDSGLEAFSHNPAHGSFAPLPDRTGANTNYVNQRFLSY